MSCSLLIITLKENNDILTLENPEVKEYTSEVLIDRSPGVSWARNHLAYQAIGEILAFMDDDVRPDKRVWELIANLRKREILMVEGYRHPITRVMAIHKEDFNDIGGFDQAIWYNGEDLDFYWRALDKGYVVSTVPKGLIHHEPHSKSNWAKYHFESAYTRVKHGRISLDFFVQTNPVIAFLRLTGFIYHYACAKWRGVKV